MRLWGLGCSADAVRGGPRVNAGRAISIGRPCDLISSLVPLERAGTKKHEINEASRFSEQAGTTQPLIIALISFASRDASIYSMDRPTRASLLAWRIRI